MMQTTCMGGMWYVGMQCRWQENMVNKLVIGLCSHTPEVECQKKHKAQRRVECGIGAHWS